MSHLDTNGSEETDWDNPTAIVRWTVSAFLLSLFLIATGIGIYLNK